MEQKLTLSKEDGIMAWHFLREDRRLRYGTQEEVIAGRVISVNGPIKLCHFGLHGSTRAIDALSYAPGPVIARTVHYGDVIVGDDKICSSYRRTIWIMDATKTLRVFACDVATIALESERAEGREPHKDSWAAVEVARRWIYGKATDNERSAARSAAWAAAWSAARSADESAAKIKLNIMLTDALLALEPMETE